MQADHLFEKVHLPLSGPVPWGTPVPEIRPGVYVVARASREVVYIGCSTKSVKLSLSQFYTHRYGNRSPHRGGQDVLLLKEPLFVHWAATTDPHPLKTAMLNAFEAAEGKVPYANKVSRSRDDAQTSSRAVASTGIAREARLNGSAAERRELSERLREAVPKAPTEETKQLLATGILDERTRSTVQALLAQDNAAPGRRRSQIEAWRQRAEELRTTADNFTLPSAQEPLRRAAANYEQMADHAEALRRGKKAPGEETG